MRWVTVLCACLPLFGSECDQSPVVVRNVSVWTGRRLDRERDVLFRDGRVAEIRRARRNFLANSGIRVIDGTGSTLLPGLVDMHLHFVIPGLPKGIDAAAVSGRQLLRSGVTAGRLHLASFADATELKRLSQDACAPMPRIQAGGPGISGGSPQVNSPAFTGVQSPEDAAEKVLRIARAKLEWLPLHNVERFSAAERDTILRTARQSGLRIFSSSATAAELRASLEAGADTLDYIDRSADPSHRPELLAQLSKAKGSALAPTVGIFERYAAYRADPALLEDPGLYEFLAPQAAIAVREQAKADLVRSPYVLESDEFRSTLRLKLLELSRTGLPLAIATDVGSTAHLHPGAIWWEMETWRRYGVPVDQVLRSATAIPAGILGMRDAGRIAVGARADFVLYRGNVLEGALDGKRVIAVGRSGVLFVTGSQWTGKSL